MPTTQGGGGADIECIELLKPERGGLGLLIVEQTDQPGVHVQEVVEGKAAALDGRVRPGDKLLAINRQDMSTSNQEAVVRVLQVRGWRVRVGGGEGEGGREGGWRGDCGY